MDTATERGGLRPGGPVAVVYEMFARRDLRGLGLLLSDDVRVTWRSDGEPVVVSGRDEVLRTLADLVNATDGTAVGEIVRATSVTAAHVRVLHRERAAWRGHVHEVDAEVLYTVRGGLITSAARESVISRRPPARHVP